MKTIPDIFDNLKHNIRQLEQLESQLTSAGCLEAGIHFKTDTKQMVLFEPIERSNGKLKHHFIGSDPQNQQRARQRVARHNLREQIRREKLELELDYKFVRQQFYQLAHELSSLVCQSNSALSDFESASRKLLVLGKQQQKKKHKIDILTN